MTRNVKHLIGRLRRLSGTAGGQLRFLLFVALPLLVIAALGIRLGFDEARDFQQELLKNDLEMIARAVSIPVGEALAEGDVKSVELALQSIFTIDRVYGASVFDQDGKRVAWGGIAESDLTESNIPRLMEVTGEKQESYRRVAGLVVFSTFQPLFNRTGQGEGFIQITRRPGDFAQPLRQMTWIAWLLWGALAITITLTVVLGYRRSIGRHVNHLVEVMAHAGSGDRGSRATTEGPPEVAGIARGLNSMLDNIQAYELELGQHREAEQALLARLKDREKMAALGDMARGFAHELGAPLSVIEGRARRLVRNDWVKPGAERELEDIRRQVQHLSATVTNLLELSRAGGGEHRQLSLGDVIRQIRWVYAASLEKGEIQVEISEDADIPELTGDAVRLQLAVSCLVRNALQAARSKVLLTTELSGDRVRIVVEDDGPGLDPETVARLKEPFFTTRASGEGTGLGLAIADSIARDHWGELQLSNRSTGGCRAAIELPLSGRAS